MEHMKDEQLAYVVESFQRRDEKRRKKKSNSTAISKRRQNDLIEEHIAMILLNQRLALKADIKRMQEIKNSQQKCAFVKLNSLGVSGKNGKGLLMVGIL